MDQVLYLFTNVIVVVLLAYSLYVNTKYSRQIKRLEQDLQKTQAENEEITGEIKKIANEPIRPELMDDFTGLPGQRVFEDRVQQSVIQSGRQKTSFAIMVVDVDNFKDVDKLGKDVGDKILRELANRFQMSLRQIDTVSRFAGGCFYFLLPYLSRAETAIYVAQRIQDNLLPTFKVEGHEIALTVSIGIAIYPLDGADTHNLIQNATVAMRLAKQKGKNQYQFCQSELQHLGQRELTLVHIIRGTDLLSKLQIQYKPYFDGVSNKVQYVQATAHLHDAKFGMVPYSKFCQLADGAGKIVEINQWLLRNAFMQLAKWQTEGFEPGRLAIPASLHQLENAHFIYAMIELMNEFKDSNVKLVLDIFDDKLPQNPVFIENLFSMLNDAGIEISVGVIALGHFAMQKINKIPLNYLKIDSKLIAASDSFQEKEMILNRIIELANDEKITVIAEGIDNDNQKARLMKLGCTLMEGKVFGYLMPTGKIIETQV